MKYIWSLIVLAACCGALILYFTISFDPPEKNVVITINQKHITRDEFSARFASVQTSAHNGNKQEFINSIIVKELMIQDAQKEGIDKDESFRRSIQDYYEQSLVKQVMDKKLKSLKVDVTDEEINRYNSFQRSTVKVTVFYASDENAANKGVFRAQEEKTLRVNDLAGDIAERLEVLQEGGHTPPLFSDSGFSVFRLDKVISRVSVAALPEDREKIRSMLIERKKQKAIDEWIANLKAKSVIKISIL